MAIKDMADDKGGKVYSNDPNLARHRKYYVIVVQRYSQ